MKKIQQKIVNLHTEKPVTLYTTIIILFIFILFGALSLSRAFFVNSPNFNTDIHTNIIYYNKGYLQDFKIEIPGTASFVINQSPETIFANIHETKNASTTFSQIVVLPNEEKIIQANDGYMILFTNASNTSTSTILVGNNFVLNKERENALKQIIFNYLNNNPESLKRAYNIFARLHSVDINIKSSCSKIAYELGQKSFQLYGKENALKFAGKICLSDFQKGINSFNK